MRSWHCKLAWKLATASLWLCTARTCTPASQVRMASRIALADAQRGGVLREPRGKAGRRAANHVYLERGRSFHLRRGAATALRVIRNHVPKYYVRAYLYNSEIDPIKMLLYLSVTSITIKGDK